MDNGGMGDTNLQLQRQVQQSISLQQEAQQQELVRQKELQQQDTAASRQQELGRQVVQQLTENLPPQQASVPQEQVPAPLKEEQAAHLSKSQKRSLKREEAQQQRQREAEQREAEKERVKSERKRAKDEEKWEKERQAGRKRLFKDDAFAEKLSLLRQQPNIKQSMQFLKDTAAILISKEDMRSAYQGTVVYSDLILPFRLLINDSVDNEEDCAALMKKLDEYQARCADIDYRNVANRVIMQELPYRLEEEFEELSDLNTAQLECAEEYENTLKALTKDIEGFETEIAKKIGAAGDNLMGHGGSHSQFRKKSTLQEFRTRVESIQQEKNISPEAAEAEALQERRVNRKREEEEKERREARDRLFGDDAFVAGLSKLAQQPNLEQGRQFVKEAAELLARKEDMASKYEGTVFYTETILPFRLLINDYVTDPGVHAALVEKMEEYKSRCEHMDHMNTVNRVIMFELPYRLEEEVMVLPMLERAMAACAEEVDAEVSAIRKYVRDFETEIAQKIGAESENLLMGSGAVYSHLRKEGTLKEFRARVESIQQEKNISAQEAEAEALRERREKLRA